MAAVPNERVSKIVGYNIIAADFSESSPNLPQRIAIIGEANEAQQAGLDTDPIQVSSAKKAGELFGYGSPIYLAMRILKPYSGDGVGGIPIMVYPQAKAIGAVAKVITITPVGVATGNVTHTLKVAGREGMEAVFYDFNIETGDVVADITAKISDALNNILGSPVIGDSTATEATATSKWAGLTANDISIEVDTNDNAAGLSYGVVNTTPGSGTPSIAAALTAFGNNWNTIVVNTYGEVSSILTALEAHNGIPDPENPTGRYVGTLQKPYVALFGSTLEDPSTLTDARLAEVTNVVCPAPLSKGLPFEAAANAALLLARQAQDAPHLDISGKSYPDMPTPDDIGAMAIYDNRDIIVKKGCSTVDLINGKYVVTDFVTTYHPVGEPVPAFRYVRTFVIDTNIRFGYYLLEQTYVVDHVIAADTDDVTAEKVVKPKTWTANVFNYADKLSKRALIVVPSFMQESIVVGISSTNPDRLETSFKYKRSGFARIASTEAEAGFNFGQL